MGEEHFFIQKRHVEVPESKALAPDFGEIKKTVCRVNGVKEEDIFISSEKRSY